MEEPGGGKDQNKREKNDLIQSCLFFPYLESPSSAELTPANMADSLDFE